jgi:adenine-specific DNA-methyltransferase
MSQKFERLKTLLKELFQLDQPDLDFGLYRIMHAKSTEVTQFLDEHLLPQVNEAFALYKSADKSEIEKELAKVVAGIEAAGMDPEQSPKVQELRARLKNDSVDVGALESEVYDHLYSFFRRYYSEGDFLSKRVYKAGVYAIPYEGEEVKLHWANADQYYIKTSEYLRDYAFRLRPDDEKKPMRVHFRLVDAAEGEHGNVKEAQGKERRFKVADTDPIALVDGELSIRFTYQPDPAKQKELNAAAEAAILTASDAALVEWIRELARLDPTEADPKRSVISKHLKQYCDRNTFDYFIHKDLGGFLRRELDFYIKNEVMHLDDVENESAARVEQYLSKIKIIRRVAGKVIDFLSQLEGFQKKVWEKKKFVVDARYCVTLDRIPKELYPEIVKNAAQWDEWVNLYALKEHRQRTSRAPSVEVLNPYYMLDTRHFDEDFVQRLLTQMENLDDSLDGVCVHSENSQALKLLKSRYTALVDCVYIDPPFNTSEASLLYKNEYRHSSWLAMVHQSLRACRPYLNDDSVVAVAIDDFEKDNLSKCLEEVFTPSGRLGTLVVETKPSGRTNDRFFATSHEYHLFFGLPGCTAEISFFPLSEEAKKQYGESDGGGAHKWRDFLRTGGFSTPAERPNSYYPIYFNAQTGEARLESFKGAVEILPTDSEDKARVWRKTRPSFIEHYARGEIKFEKRTSGKWKVLIIDRIKEGVRPKSVWVGSKYDAATHGTKLLKKFFGDSTFGFPKALGTTQDAIFCVMGNADSGWVVDYFAGSGTTGHAVIELNRADAGTRKYLLVEMGHHFETVLVPRLKKVIYSSEWSEGEPQRRDHGLSHAFKVLRLESYEDALNNLETARTDSQISLLDAAEAKKVDSLREQYMLRYMLDVETRGSQSLLNVQAFVDPTAYKLKVKRPGSDESREVNVDLLETFNWLIGLTVKHIAAPQVFAAAFERDGEGRLKVKDRIRQEAAGPFWFRTVTGTTPEGRKTLVIWRKLTGKPEEDNLVLDEWFTRQGYSSKDSEFDLIYVNGGNNLENLKAPDDTWKVRLIEEDFHRLMFETDGA